MTGKTNADVVKVFIKHQNCAYLPRNLGQFFPNLLVLYVMKSNVQYLEDGDLAGLDKLEIFDVSHNPVEQVGANYFKGHSSIRTLSFYDCHIKKVEKGALDELKKLEKIHFDGNVCLDQKFEIDYDTTLEEVCDNIYDKCHGRDHTLRTNLTETCGEHRSAEMSELKGDHIERESTDSWSIVLIILLALTTIMNVVFAIALYRVFKGNFSGSWHEMRNVLV
jgi:hypothetical protein